MASLPARDLYCPRCRELNYLTAKFCGRCGATLAVSRSLGEVKTPTSADEQAALSDAAKHDKFIGHTIDGRYRIDGLIGLGGMGSVYRVTRVLIGDFVAMKILHTERVADPSAAERFRREAQAAARLKHPNVVSIYDVGITSDGLQYLVMELLEGQSLRQIIKQQGPLPTSVAVEITTQICAAMDEAHRQHIIHRDIKPDNLIVHSTSAGLRVKVLDFGIAKLRDDVASHLTQTGSVMGTPHYMSPEQCLGEELDNRADIYSLGIVLYEMLCGRVPFNSPVSTAVVVQHVNQPPPSLRAINPGISPQVEAVVFHALEKQRGARPPTAGVLARELAAAVYPTSVPTPGYATWPQTSGPLPPPAHDTEETVMRSAAGTPAANEMPATVHLPGFQASGPTPSRPTFPSGIMGAAQTNQRLLLTIGAAVCGVVLLGAVVAMIARSLRKPNDVAGLNKPDNSRTTEKTGTFAINPQFDAAEEFSEGLAGVRVGGKSGYIDKTGKMAIIPQFDAAYRFSEGLAQIGFASKFGYIDKTGTVVITPQFNAIGEVCRFYEGLAAAVPDGDFMGRWGYIDKTGKMVITPQFDSVGVFSEGLAEVRIGDDKTGRWGYIDKTGKVVITPQFDLAHGFSEGLAPVRIGDDKTGRWGYIDKAGKVVINPQFSDAWPFSEGLAPVRIGDEKTDKWGCIDKTGQVVITPQFDAFQLFAEGLAAVRIGDDKTGKWGFINKTGNVVITPQFDLTSGFSEGQGLATVRIGDDKTGKWGFIDKAGKVVITPQFDSVGKFSEGLALVMIGDDKTGKWGYIFR